MLVVLEQTCRIFQYCRWNEQTLTFSDILARWIRVPLCSNLCVSDSPQPLRDCPADPILGGSSLPSVRRKNKALPRTVSLCRKLPPPSLAFVAVRAEPRPHRERRGPD